MNQHQQNNWNAAVAALLPVLKTGQMITGIELPVNIKPHVVQFLTITPEGHPQAGRIIDITDHVSILLNQGKASEGFYKGGAQLSSDAHGSIRAAIRVAVEKLGESLYGTKEAAGFDWQTL